METLGQFIKREREFKGVSLEQLSMNTKISVEFLKKMEEDRFEELPKGAFVKGFLKSYARAVQLSENEVLSRFQPVPVRSTPQEGFLQKARQFEIKRQVVLIVLFILGVIVLATFLSSR